MVLEIGPKGGGGFTQGVKAEIEKKIFSICPQVTNKCSNLCPCIGLKTEKKKRYYEIWEANLPPWGGGGGRMFQHLIIF